MRIPLLYFSIAHDSLFNTVLTSRKMILLIFFSGGKIAERKNRA